jgi:hypothetical protein
MIFQNKYFTYYMTVERLGILTLRFSVGYVDRKDKVYEMTFDI